MSHPLAGGNPRPFQPYGPGKTVLTLGSGTTEAVLGESDPCFAMLRYSLAPGVAKIGGKFTCSSLYAEARENGRKQRRRQCNEQSRDRENHKQFDESKPSDGGKLRAREAPTPGHHSNLDGTLRDGAVGTNPRNPMPWDSQTQSGHIAIGHESNLSSSQIIDADQRDQNGCDDPGNRHP